MGNSNYNIGCGPLRLAYAKVGNFGFWYLVAIVVNTLGHKGQAGGIVMKTPDQSTPFLNRDYDRDPNITALKRKGVIDHGSTLDCLFKSSCFLNVMCACVAPAGHPDVPYSLLEVSGCVFIYIYIYVGVSQN